MGQPLQYAENLKQSSAQAAALGYLLVPDTTARDLLVTDAVIRKNTVCHVEDSGLQFQWDGAAWQSFSATPDPTGNIGKALFVGAGDLPLWRFIKAADVVPVFDLTSFSLTSHSSLIERGDQIGVGAVPTDPVQFSAAANRQPDTASLTDTDGTPAQDVQPNFSAASPSSANYASTGTFQKSAVGGSNESVTFTTSAVEDDDADALNASITWARRFYIKASTDPGVGNYNDAFIKAGSVNSIKTGRANTFSVTAAAGEFAFFAYNAAYGAVVKIVDNDTGFDVTGAFTEVEAAAVVTTENAAAIGESYRFYKSNNAGLGTLNLTVT